MASIEDLARISEALIKPILHMRCSTCRKKLNNDREIELIVGVADINFSWGNDFRVNCSLEIHHLR